MPSISQRRACVARAVGQTDAPSDGDAVKSEDGRKIRTKPCDGGG
ncbi:hypothetical protein SAMN04488094_1431, partial [Tropicimonas isoalkanivorans]